MSVSRSQPRVAIVTLNWNRPDDTLECLASATAQTHTHIFIVVVDNASNDDSVVRISTTFPDVTILQNPRNLGFASGANRGLRHALDRGADYVFLVNNDTTFASDCLARLLEHTTSDVGALTPAIYYTAEPKQPWSLGGRKHWLTLEKTGDTPKALKQANTNGFLDRDYVVGCGLLFSRAMLEQVGLFDDQFFMYYEDMDLSFRIRQNGFRILLIPKARMWHKVAVSSGGSDSPNERYWMARSSVLFFRKYVHGMRWLIVVPFRTGSAIKTVVRLSMHGRFRATRAYLRGLRDGLRTPLCA
ncbi:MAG: glycosyltransferase family 2 protein [Chloroflexi bacterium AL-W]|nr:glycosyltransferase family 2 protein [Chloroflexi bacterium AL-N1]NOK67712.1 glycosyltransferase family 2 protein [Chloroflexi bacterium AL-N10]NOK75518.1 glycosyltransferase family 2 protein [Chloroflexi bacterium AL-N5]NOK82306.1 glycosyltransferase family 2 protein [Chloroflexi bacterium AL-W]NOK90151.1 glycosyltransferase family 2 protein [Chloroflexi bacterium AL-N15]